MKRSCACTSRTASSPTAGRAAACAIANIAEQNFREATGLDLPRTLNPQDPARQADTSSGGSSVSSISGVCGTRKSAPSIPDASYIANAGGGALSDLDMKTIAELSPTMVADRQSRRGIMAPWANGKNGKEYRATMGSKAIAGMFNVGIDDEHRWKDSVQNGDEIRLWVADGIAQGLRPWFIKFNAKPEDRRWLPVVKEIFAWHYANETIPEKSSARWRKWAWSTRSKAPCSTAESRPAKKSRSRDWVSIKRSLSARIPFEMVHDRCLDEEHLAPFRTLILPNIAALSDAQCASLRAFVERGGGLGRYLPDFALRRVGCAAQRFRSGLALWRIVRRQGPGKHAQFVPEPGERSRRLASGIRCCAALKTRDASSTP
jgi:hypothetical protein